MASSSWADIVASECLDDSRDGLNLLIKQTLNVGPKKAVLGKISENEATFNEQARDEKIKAKKKTSKNKPVNQLQARRKTASSWKNVLMSDEGKKNSQENSSDNAEMEVDLSTVGTVTISSSGLTKRKRLACEMTPKLPGNPEEPKLVKTSTKGMARSAGSEDSGAKVQSLTFSSEPVAPVSTSSFQAAATLSDRQVNILVKKSLSAKSNWASDSEDEDEELEETDRLAASDTASDAMSTLPEKPLEELTEERIAKRQKQIDLGKMTEGYQNYIKLVSKSARAGRQPRRHFPSTPEKEEKISKRFWDGKVRSWRRALHCWDADGEAFKAAKENGSKKSLFSAGKPSSTKKKAASKRRVKLETLARVQPRKTRNSKANKV